MNVSVLGEVGHLHGGYIIGDDIIYTHICTRMEKNSVGRKNIPEETLSQKPDPNDGREGCSKPAGRIFRVEKVTTDMR